MKYLAFIFRAGMLCTAVLISGCLAIQKQDSVENNRNSSESSSSERFLGITIFEPRDGEILKFSRDIVLHGKIHSTVDEIEFRNSCNDDVEKKKVIVRGSFEYFISALKQNVCFGQNEYKIILMTDTGDRFEEIITFYSSMGPDPGGNPEFIENMVNLTLYDQKLIEKRFLEPIILAREDKIYFPCDDSAEGIDLMDSATSITDSLEANVKIEKSPIGRAVKITWKGKYADAEVPVITIPVECENVILLRVYPSKKLILSTEITETGKRKYFVLHHDQWVELTSRINKVQREFALPEIEVAIGQQTFAIMRSKKERLKHSMYTDFPIQEPRFVFALNSLSFLGITWFVE